MYQQPQQGQAYQDPYGAQQPQYGQPPQYQQQPQPYYDPNQQQQPPYQDPNMQYQQTAQPMPMQSQQQQMQMIDPNMPPVIGVVGILPSSADGIPVPARIMCPGCQREATTVVQTKPGPMTFCCCVTLLFVFWPCMCAPFFIDDCKDKQHTCPHCQREVGKKPFELC